MLVVAVSISLPCTADDLMSLASTRHKMLLWFLILTLANNGATMNESLNTSLTIKTQLVASLNAETNLPGSVPSQQILNGGSSFPISRRSTAVSLKNARMPIKSRHTREVSSPHTCSLHPSARPVVKDKKFIVSLYLLIIAVGMVWNTTILIIYYRHPEMRTKNNAIFVNMAIADTLFLIVHLGIFKIGFYFGLVKYPAFFGQTGCRIYVLSFVTSFGINAYTVAAISAQRYLGLVRFSGSTAENIRVFLYKPFILPWLVWTLCIILAIPEVVSTKICNADFRCYHPHLFTDGETPCILYGVVPVAITAAFFILAERGQENSTREAARMRTGKVLLALGIVYVCTYTPMLVCELVRDWFDTSAHHEEPTVIYCYIAKVIFHLNPTCNPLALYVASLRFRIYFKKYLFCSSQALDEPGQLTLDNQSSLTSRT